MQNSLAVSRFIIEAHDGQLWAENNPDCGAKFSIKLPGCEGTAFGEIWRAQFWHTLMAQGSRSRVVNVALDHEATWVVGSVRHYPRLRRCLIMASTDAVWL
jgi:hypothetical protein